MRWDVAQEAFVDELQKIGEYSLAGFSPQSLLEKGQPAPPMETPALSRANAILDRYEASRMQKVASPRVSNVMLPGVQTLTSTDRRGKKQKVHVVVADRAKSLGAHALGGAAAGKLVGEAIPHLKASRIAVRRGGRLGVAIGAGLGAAEFGRKRVAERIAASKTKHAMVTPKGSLRASSNTGTIRMGLHKTFTGPKPFHIGRKFRLPKPW